MTYRRFIADALAFLVLSCALLTVQLGVVAVIAPGFSIVDVVLVAAIIGSILFRYSIGVTIGLTSSILIDLFTDSRWHESIGILAALFLTNALFLRFFTNRSLWTLLILGGVATIIVRLVEWLMTAMPPSLDITIATQLVLHSALFTILFFAIRLVRASMRPYLLIRGGGGMR